MLRCACSVFATEVWPATVSSGFLPLPLPQWVQEVHVAHGGLRAGPEPCPPPRAPPTPKVGKASASAPSAPSAAGVSRDSRHGSHTHDTGDKELLGDKGRGGGHHSGRQSTDRDRWGTDNQGNSSGSRVEGDGSGGRVSRRGEGGAARPSVSSPPPRLFNPPAPSPTETRGMTKGGEGRGRVKSWGQGGAGATPSAGGRASRMGAESSAGKMTEGGGRNQEEVLGHLEDESSGEEDMDEDGGRGERIRAEAHRAGLRRELEEIRVEKERLRALGVGGSRGTKDER